MRQNTQYIPRFAAAKGTTNFSNQIRDYARDLDMEVVVLSSNSESSIMDALCEAQERAAVDGCVINPGGNRKNEKNGRRKMNEKKKREK